VRTPRVLLAILLLAGSAAPEEAEPGRDFVDPRVADLDPVETVRPHPSRVVVSGRILGSYGAPSVALIRPDGRAVEVTPVHYSPPSFRVEIPLGSGRGIYRVELRAVNPAQLTHSGARLRFFAGVPASTPEEVAPGREPPPAEATSEFLEADLFARVNEHRRRAGLDPFVWLEPLARACRAHLATAIAADRLDQRVDGGPLVSERLAKDEGWARVINGLPSGPPDPTPGAVSTVGVATDSNANLDLVLYRWRHFAAFCLPMTSEWMTHAACAVARSKQGFVFVVFAFAQFNEPSILDSIEAQHGGLAKRVRAQRLPAGDEDAAAIRELARWGRREGRAEAKKHLGSRDPAVRAAAWDAMLLYDRDDSQRELGREVERLRAAAGDPARATEAEVLRAWLGRLLLDPGVSAEVRALGPGGSGAGEGPAPPGK
jgi:hypothetical protein